jgi:hypothetical protein
MNHSGPEKEEAARSGSGGQQPVCPRLATEPGTAATGPGTEGGSGRAPRPAGRQPGDRDARRQPLPAARALHSAPAASFRDTNPASVEPAIE